MAEAALATRAAPGADAPPEPPNAFISYSHLDRDFAIRVRDALQARGKRVWLDETEIRGGTRWSDALQRAIESADAFLFLLSPYSAASQECGAELARALALNKRILPLRVAETPMADLPAGLRAYQFIPSRELFGAHFDGSLEQLVTEIDTDREWVREHTDWSEKATEWERHDRDRSYLLSGDELQAAEAWRSRAAGKRPGLSALQNEMIDASRAWSTQRLRRTRGAVSVGLAIAIALSIVAFILRQQAVNDQQIARSGEYSAQSLLQLATDPQLSLLLAVRAAQTKRTAPALDALRRAIPQNHLARTFQTDSAPLNDAGVSADGKLVLTASEDGTARLWDAATGAVLRRLPFSTFYNQGASFAARAPELLTWGGNGVHVWPTDTGGSPVTIDDPSFGKLQQAEISADGRYVATAASGGAGAELLFDAHTGQLLHVLERPGPNDDTIAFSPDGQLVATGSQGLGTASVWSTATGELVQRLTVGSSNLAVLQVAFSPDSSELVTEAETTDAGSATSAVWNPRSGRRLTTVPGASPVFSPGGGYVATVHSDGSGGVYRTKDGSVVAQLKSTTPLKGPISFAPDSHGQITALVTGSTDGQAVEWNALTGTELETLSGDAGRIWSAGFMPGGQQLLTASSDGAARLWSTSGLSVHRAGEPRALGVDQATALESDYLTPPDPLNPFRAYGPYGQGAKVVNVQSGATLRQLPRLPTGGSYYAMGVDPGGRTVLAMRASGGSTSGALPAEVAHPAVSGALRTLSGPGSVATGGAVSPDASLVAAVDGQNAIGVWSATTGREVTVFRGHQGVRTNYGQANVDLRFSPDGRLVVSADEAGRAFVWQARTGHVLNRIQGEAVPLGQYAGMGGAISPDDRTVVITRSWDDVAHVYRVGQPAEVIELRGHADGISDSAFSPDGSLIATVSAGDGTARVWDPQHQDPLLTLPLTDFASRVQFTGDGQSLATNGAFPYETLGCLVCGGFDRLLTLARQRETRGFTAQEHSLYLTG